MYDNDNVGVLVMFIFIICRDSKCGVVIRCVCGVVLMIEFWIRSYVVNMNGVNKCNILLLNFLRIFLLYYFLLSGFLVYWDCRSNSF